MAKRKKKTYPFSRAYTHPLTGAVGGGAFGGLSTLLAAKALNLRGGKKYTAAGAALGALLGGGSTWATRELIAHNLRRSIRNKSKSFSPTEKDLFLGGVKTRNWRGDTSKDIGQHLISPTSMGATKGLYGLALGGPAAGVLMGLRGAIGTSLYRWAGARALKGRHTTGKGLFKREAALLKELKALKRKRGRRR